MHCSKVNACSLMEQVTRVELAGNSLGSCRHTARRHLLMLRQAKHSAPLNAFIIYPFYENVNAF